MAPAEQDLTQRPIPLDLLIETTSSYRNVACDLECAEFSEPLVDLSSLGISNLAFYARTDGQNAPYNQCLTAATPTVLLRSSAAAKLAEANKALSKFGVEIHAHDGYRSHALQEELWRHFVARARQQMPEADENAWTEHAIKYCSDPRRFNAADPTTWTLHITGGAVDVTLIRLSTGMELNFGGDFDDAAPASHTGYFETECSDAASREARDNRRLLYWAMIDVGFTNYAYEWWHYDYGNQLWALQQGANQKAKYGPVTAAAKCQ